VIERLITSVTAQADAATARHAADVPFTLGIIAALCVVTVALFAYLRSQNGLHRREIASVERALHDSRRQHIIMRKAALNAGDGIVYQDMCARILWANPAYCRTMGYDLEEIIGRRPQEFCFPPESRPTDEEIENFVYDPGNEEFQKLVRRYNMRRNGERFWQEFSLSLIEPVPGEQRVILVTRDVTEQVAREEELEKVRAGLQHAAHHDALTGLKNRYAFLKAADDILQGGDRRNRKIGLLYIDLDKFKQVNDSHGHAAGDAVLVHVADAIRGTLRSDDLACRLGGDEFLVACIGVSDFKTLEMIADALLEKMRTPFVWGDTTLTTGASIGLAISDENIGTAEDLIRIADFALYEAKEPGRPRVASYDAALHERMQSEKALMEDFVNALDAGELSFLYQPVYDAELGRITSFEALARWERADGTVLTPDRFLPFASKLNRMPEIDFCAIRNTASLAAELARKGHRIRGAFNTSADALAHPRFMDRLHQSASDAGIASGDLIAEVLETTFFGPDTADSVAANRISELRAMGFHIYLDDFGVGYAGLAHLGQLDITGIKLDRSLVANVVTDRSARIIATSILRMCKELGVSSLAEGIETAEQAEFLVAHGCTRLQGFGIARPMSREKLVDLITSGAAIDIPSAARSARLSA